MEREDEGIFSQLGGAGIGHLPPTVTERGFHVSPKRKPAPQIWTDLLSGLRRTVPACVFAAAQDYTLTDIGPFAVPVALNSSGQVTGTTTQTGHDSSFFWTRTGGLQILPDLGSGSSDAKAMNDSGAIVGQSGLANHAIHAFLWTQAGGIKDLGSPLGGNSIAYAINTAGEVSGLTFSPDGAIAHAFFWSPSTGAIDLGVSNGNSTSFPLGMNGAGEIVGYQFGTSGFTAFRWTLATGMDTLARDLTVVIDGFGKAIRNAKIG